MPSDTGCDTPQVPEKLNPARSTLVSRNVTIAGHRTSVRLEPEMWSGLSEICRRERASLHEIGTAVAMRKQESTSLTAAIRVFVMTYFRVAATEDGHIKAGHGYGAIVGTASVNAAAMPRTVVNNNAPLMMNSSKMDGTTRRF